jgi:hypothetical protein
MAAERDAVVAVVSAFLRCRDTAICEYSPIDRGLSPNIGPEDRYDVVPKRTGPCYIERKDSFLLRKGQKDVWKLHQRLLPLHQNTLFVTDLRYGDPDETATSKHFESTESHDTSMPSGERFGSPLGNCPKSQAQIYVRDGLFL